MTDDLSHAYEVVAHKLSEAAEEREHLRRRNEQALNLALEYGQIDGGHHKTWVIDQMVRALTGTTYADFVGDDWDEGIAP